MKHKMLMSVGVGILFLAAGCCWNPWQCELSQVFDTHAIFGSHMVLQQGKPIVFSGKAEPGKIVKVNFNRRTVDAKADRTGEWQAKFPAMTAGGPYTVTISGKEPAKVIVFSDVMVGEVWICSGQSNMQMPVSSGNPFWRTKDYLNEVKNANHKNLRLYQGTRRTSPSSVLPEASGSGWEVCSPKTVGKFSACGYFFGRQIMHDLNVPVGMIHLSWGGTRIQAWISEQTFKDAKRVEAVVIENERAIANDPKIQKDLKAKEAALQAKLHASLKKWFKDFDSEFKKVRFEGQKPELNDSKWAKTDAPITFKESCDGSMWARKIVTIPADWAGKDIVLNLGAIDDCDETYFNGIKIGITDTATTNYWSKIRSYIVPGKIVKAGRNVLAIRIFDYFGDGGIVSPKLEICQKAAPSKKIDISKDWRTKHEFSFDQVKFGIRPNIEPAVGRQHPNFPSTLYNGMIYPWLKYNIRGVIWYQGCSNAGSSDYYNLHKLLIRNWRKDWNTPNMPFIIVQLAGFQSHRPNNRFADDFWKHVSAGNAPYALTREIQDEMLKLPNVGLAVSMDIGDHSDIHPRNKQDVGFRLAKEAERIAYGVKAVSHGPRFIGMKIEGNKIRVSFTDIGKGLTTKDGKAPGAFAIAGKDGKFVWANARIDGKTVVVWSDKVSAPVHVRYAYTQYRGDVNLCNKEGFPAYPFRSDKPVYK